MTTIFFEQTEAYLPEIPAYCDYLAESAPHIKCVVGRSGDPLQSYADILWRFTGIDQRGRLFKDQLLVHEYNSLSTGYAAKLKNKIKKLVNPRPDMRVFLNENVEREFVFKDLVPAYRRDMGVDDLFFEAAKTAEKPNLRPYDFVYAGTLNRGPIVKKCLKHFADGPMKSMSLYLVGTIPDYLAPIVERADNIISAGRVPYKEVAGHMLKARYGLNIMPDIYPLNLQTATKVLEYCALGLPVVSKDYKWIREFESERKASFLKLDYGLQNFTPQTVRAQTFIVPDVSDLRWKNVIAQSGLFERLF